MKFRSPTTWSNQLCSLQLGAGHSSQIRSDVSFASPQNLQVDGRDPHHLYRWPSKTMWPVVAYMRVVISFILIHLIILFWCVMGVAWFCIVEPCSTIAVFFVQQFFSSDFPFSPLEGRMQKLNSNCTFLPFNPPLCSLWHLSAHKPNPVLFFSHEFCRHQQFFNSSTSLLLRFKEKIYCRGDC